MSDTVPAQTIVKKQPRSKYIILSYARTGRIPLPASDIKTAKIMRQKLRERSTDSVIYKIRRVR